MAYFTFFKHLWLKCSTLDLTFYYRVQSVKVRDAVFGHLDGACGSSSCAVSPHYWNAGSAIFCLDSSKVVTRREWLKPSRSNVSSRISTWNCARLSCTTLWTWCPKASSKTKPAPFCSTFLKLGDVGKLIFPGRCVFFIGWIFWFKVRLKTRYQACQSLSRIWFYVTWKWKPIGGLIQRTTTERE